MITFVDMTEKLYTIAQFAAKIGKNRTTVFRWLTEKKKKKKLIGYGAAKKIIAGKTFIQQEI